MVKKPKVMLLAARRYKRRVAVNGVNRGMKIELFKFRLTRHAGERAVKHAQASLKLKWRNTAKMLDLNGKNR